MALLLPQCSGLPESLHQLAGLRRRVAVQPHSRRSCRSVRAKHGATESSTRTQVASNDHIRIAGTEPCCTISSIVMVPRKPARRSSRLRAKKGREAAKTEPAEDMEAAEWASRIPVNNGMVEIDPVTMAEIRGGNADTTNTHNRTASLTTSSEVPDYFPPRGPRFPRIPGVPFEVLVAAGSAIALAIVAAILNAVSNQRVGAKTRGSDSEDKKLSGDKGASTAGVSAGGAIYSPFDMRRGSSRTGPDYSSLPLPPSLSKNGSKRDSPPHQKQGEWDSVTPFFTEHKSPDLYPKPAPSNSKWSEDKYKSVPPFFPSDRSAANGSSLENVTPFFADEQQGSESRNGTSLENVPPFFADDQGMELKNGPSLEAVAPFFADEQQGSESRNGTSLENVPPFFADDQGRESKNGPSLEAVAPFFADEQQGRSSSGASQSKGSDQKVAPSFPDDRVGISGSTGQSPNVAERDSLAAAVSFYSAPKLDRMVNPRGTTPVDSSQFSDQRSVGDESVSAAVPEDLLSGPVQAEGKEMLANMANQTQDQHTEFMDATAEDRLGSSFRGEEAPSVARDLSPEELALLEEVKVEEAKQHAKFQALQAAFPALAIGAGAVGALVGVDGAFEMVGITATASFISYELMWANKRKELLDEISRITDHHKLFNFLQKRKIVKDDC